MGRASKYTASQRKRIVHEWRTAPFGRKGKVGKAYKVSEKTLRAWMDKQEDEDKNGEEDKAIARDYELGMAKVSTDARAGSYLDRDAPATTGIVGSLASAGFLASLEAEYDRLNMLAVSILNLIKLLKSNG